MRIVFEPPLHEVDLLEHGNRHLLRTFLSADPQDEARPLALVQRAFFTATRPVLLGQFDLIYRRGTRPHQMPLLSSPERHREVGALIALRLGADELLPKALHHVSVEETIGYDRFMREPVYMTITHLPGGALLRWDMDDLRVKKLLANNAPGASEGLRENNPLAALGTLMVQKPDTAHDRLGIVGDIADSQVRINDLIRTQVPADVQIAPLRRAALAI